jgi:DNA invertase Pin-like site-specific DNA recombinase
MLADAERRKFDVLLIWALDRLSREGTIRTLLLLDQPGKAGVKVRSLSEPWLGPASPTYELLLPIFAWIARQESLRISERVKAATPAVSRLPDPKPHPTMPGFYFGVHSAPFAF